MPIRQKGEHMQQDSYNFFPGVLHCRGSRIPEFIDYLLQPPKDKKQQKRFSVYWSVSAFSVDPFVFQDRHSASPDPFSDCHFGCSVRVFWIAAELL